MARCCIWFSMELKKFVESRRLCNCKVGTKLIVESKNILHTYVDKGWWHEVVYYQQPKAQQPKAQRSDSFTICLYRMCWNMSGVHRTKIGPIPSYWRNWLIDRPLNVPYESPNSKTRGPSEHNFFFCFSFLACAWIVLCAWSVIHVYLLLVLYTLPFVEIQALLNLCHMLHIYIHKIVAAFRGMHVSPAKHSYGSVTEGGTDGQTDRQTDRQTDKRRTKWSLCVPMCRYASQAT